VPDFNLKQTDKCTQHINLEIKKRVIKVTHVIIDTSKLMIGNIVILSILLNY